MARPPVGGWRLHDAGWKSPLAFPGTRGPPKCSAGIAVVAGQVRLPSHVYQTYGIEAAVACMQESMKLSYAVSHSEELLAQAAGRLAREHLSDESDGAVA